jgi:hypothetical protein
VGNARKPGDRNGLATALAQAIGAQGDALQHPVDLFEPLLAALGEVREHPGGVRLLGTLLQFVGALAFCLP